MGTILEPNELPGQGQSRILKRRSDTFVWPTKVNIPQYVLMKSCATPACSSPTLPGGSPALTWVQGAADHAGHDDEEHGQDLQVAPQHRASLGMGQTLGRERPLHNDLKRHQWRQDAGAGPGSAQPQVSSDGVAACAPAVVPEQAPPSVHADAQFSHREPPPPPPNPSSWWVGPSLGVSPGPCTSTRWPAP